MKTFMLVTGGLGSGGLERMSCLIANRFVELGWRVVILTLLQKEDDERSFQKLNNAVKVISFDKGYDPIKHKIKSISHWKKMIKKAINEYKPDSILAMTFKIASLVCLSNKNYASKVTVREISDPKSKSRNQFVNKITEHLCKNVKNVIFQTKWEQSCYGKLIQNKGVIIPNPISINIERCGTHKEKKFFTLSRLLISQKRQDVLIDAFKVFHDKHLDYKLEIYGEGPDKEILESTIVEKECSDFVKIIDPIPNIHNKIIDYRGFVMTSDFEGMSNALLEAYCLGIPCITSDWPGVEDVVENKVDGLVYKRQNINQLVDCLNAIAENNDLCDVLTKTARTRVSRFEQERILNKYCEVIINE